MTALVGILCKDGVVVGSDSSATFTAGNRLNTIEQLAKKIEIIDNTVIVAGTGEVGLGQRFCEVVRSNWTGRFRMNPPMQIAKEFSKLGAKDFEETHMNHIRQPGCYGALVAFPQNRDFYLCELQGHNFQ